MKNAFCFILNTLFVLKILKFLSWLFWSCRKTWLENLWRHNVGNKQLQNAYCPISQKVKIKSKSEKFGQIIDYDVKIFFFKNHPETKVGRPVPDLCFLRKLYMKWKQVFYSLASIYFDSPRLRHAVKTNWIKL